MLRGAHRKKNSQRRVVPGKFSRRHSAIVVRESMLRRLEGAEFLGISGRLPDGTKWYASTIRYRRLQIKSFQVAPV